MHFLKILLSALAIATAVLLQSGHGQGRDTTTNVHFSASSGAVPLSLKNLPKENRGTHRVLVRGMSPRTKANMHLERYFNMEGVKDQYDKKLLDAFKTTLHDDSEMMKRLLHKDHLENDDVCNLVTAELKMFKHALEQADKPVPKAPPNTPEFFSQKDEPVPQILLPKGQARFCYHSVPRALVKDDADDMQVAQTCGGCSIL